MDSRPDSCLRAACATLLRRPLQGHADRGEAGRPLVTALRDASFDLKLDQLMERKSLTTLTEPIAVASFVDLDTLKDTNWMGLQIEESFIYELNRRGEVVVDFKTTGSIQVTPSGDFVMSRNYKDLSARLPISRILTGTFSRNSQGILVNARIIDLRTKMVETTAQSLIPQQYLSGASNSFGRASVNRGYLMRGGQSASGHLVNLTP